MTGKSVYLGTSISQLSNALDCVLVLIYIETSDGLETLVKQGICEKTLIYLDQEKTMNDL